VTYAEVVRFWAKVDLSRGDDGCWIWMRARTPDGYGRVGVDHKIRFAHRVAYELEVGPIPDGLILDHLCRRPMCVNPRHLEPVTQRENIIRGRSLVARNAAATHCVHGHPFDDANTYRRANGGRACRACRLAGVMAEK
jgi:hypothetical protein